MMGDNHYENQRMAPNWANKCAHCGRFMHRGFNRRFGSNACRQAAYRARLSRYVDGGDRGRDRTEGRNAPGRRQKESAPPSVANITVAGGRPIGRRFRGKQKGGAA